MKLSDAIMLGRNLCKSAHNPDDPTNKQGCALTMASLAVGAKPVARLGGGVFNLWHSAQFVWPWLTKEAIQSCPFGCSPFDIWEYSQKLRIAHLFDAHVISGEWTLEQLVDYVRTIEPPEPDAVFDLEVAQEHRAHSTDTENTLEMSRNR